MSATPKPAVWTGYFDKSGSPALRIRVSGPFGPGAEFSAILDTGFTGFVCMPLLKALPIGLMLLGTTSVEQADGSNAIKLTARGSVRVGSETQIGIVVLEPTGSDVLIGMSFLRLFKKALVVATESVVLVDEAKIEEHELPSEATATDKKVRKQKKVAYDPSLGDAKNSVDV